MGFDAAKAAEAQPSDMRLVLAAADRGTIYRPCNRIPLLRRVRHKGEERTAYHPTTHAETYPMPKVKVVMSMHGRGEVFIDGEKVENVRDIRMSAGVDELNKVQITLVANELEFEGEAEVTTIQDDHHKYTAGRKAVDNPYTERGF